MKIIAMIYSQVGLGRPTQGPEQKIKNKNNILCDYKAEIYETGITGTDEAFERWRENVANSFP